MVSRMSSLALSRCMSIRVQSLPFALKLCPATKLRRSSQSNRLKILACGTADSTSSWDLEHVTQDYKCLGHLPALDSATPEPTSDDTATALA